MAALQRREKLMSLQYYKVEKLINSRSVASSHPHKSYPATWERGSNCASVIHKAIQRLGNAAPIVPPSLIKLSNDVVTARPFATLVEHGRDGQRFGRVLIKEVDDILERAGAESRAWHPAGDAHVGVPRKILHDKFRLLGSGKHVRTRHGPGRRRQRRVDDSSAGLDHYLTTYCCQ